MHNHSISPYLNGGDSFNLFGKGDRLNLGKEITYEIETVSNGHVAGEYIYSARQVNGPDPKTIVFAVRMIRIIQPK